MADLQDSLREISEELRELSSAFDEAKTISSEVMMRCENVDDDIDKIEWNLDDDMDKMRKKFSNEMDNIRKRHGDELERMRTDFVEDLKVINLKRRKLSQRLRSMDRTLTRMGEAKKNLVKIIEKMKKTDTAECSARKVLSAENISGVPGSSERRTETYMSHSMSHTFVQIDSWNLPGPNLDPNFARQPLPSYGQQLQGASGVQDPRLAGSTAVPPYHAFQSQQYWQYHSQ